MTLNDREALLHEARALRKRIDETDSTGERERLKDRCRDIETSLAQQSSVHLSTPPSKRYSTAGVIAEPGRRGASMSKRFRTTVPPPRAKGRSAATSHDTQSTVPPRYRALRIIVYFFWLFGAAMLVMSALSAWLIATDSVLPAFFWPALTLLAGAFGFIVCVTVAELIRLAIDIGDNTRRTAAAVEALSAERNSLS
jgi:hypothetical protein